jgi:hypothetical protein
MRRSSFHESATESDETSLVRFFHQGLLEIALHPGNWHTVFTFLLHLAMLSKPSSGLLGSFSQWQLSTIPVAAALILVHAIGIPALQAQQRHTATAPIVDPILPAPPSLGTPGLDEEPDGSMTPLEAGMPQVRRSAPFPKNLAVSPERQAEVMAKARAQQHDFRLQNEEAHAIHPGFGLDLHYSEEGMTLRPRTNNPTSPANNWSVRFAPTAVIIDSETLAEPDEPSPVTIESNRASRLVAQETKEWWINAEEGPEHGFTIAKSPHSAPRTLNIDLSLRSELQISQKEGSLFFTDQNERIVLTYSKLLVHDADDRILASEMHLQKREDSWTVTLKADLTDAVFPITVDPVVGTQVEETLASDGSAGDEFGFASDGIGKILAVSSPRKESGKVYLFHEDHGGPGAWDEKTSVVIPASQNPVDGDRFGHGLAVFEDETNGKTYLAVGAPEHKGTGSVFIYERHQGGTDNWGFMQILQDVDLLSGDQFGTAIDGLGNTLAIGAPGHGPGAVFLFEVAEGKFSRNQKVTTPPGQTLTDTNEFGAAVALGGDHMVIGAPGENSENGGAYLLKRSSPYAILFRLFSDKSEAGARFGAVVAIAFTGLLLAIGMPFDDVTFGPTLVNAGSVFIYAFLATTLAWGFLTAMFGTEAGALFGSALALNFFFDLAVGARGATSTTNPLKIGGAVFLFLFNSFLFAYGPANKIVPSTFIDVGMALGTSLVLLGTALFILGAAYSAFKGAMFLFKLTATLLTFSLWQQLFWTQDQIDNHPEVTGPLADPDGDGLVNKVEFAMFLIPVLFTSLASLGLLVSDGKFHFVVQQSLVAIGVLLFIQYAQLLNTWFNLDAGPLSGQFSVKVLHGGIQAQQLQFTIPALLARALFTRVSAN